MNNYDFGAIPGMNDALLNLYMRRIQRAEQEPGALGDFLGALQKPLAGYGEYQKNMRGLADKETQQIYQAITGLKPLLEAGQTAEENIRQHARKMELEKYQQGEQSKRTAYPGGGAYASAEGLKWLTPDQKKKERAVYNSEGKLLGWLTERTSETPGNKYKKAMDVARTNLLAKIQSAGILANPAKLRVALQREGMRTLEDPENPGHLLLNIYGRPVQVSAKDLFETTATEEGKSTRVDPLTGIPVETITTTRRKKLFGKSTFRPSIEDIAKKHGGY